MFSTNQNAIFNQKKYILLGKSYKLTHKKATRVLCTQTLRTEGPSYMLNLVLGSFPNVRFMSKISVIMFIFTYTFVKDFLAIVKIALCSENCISQGSDVLT